MKNAAEDERMLRTRKLPVLLFIHGDNLFWGSGNYVDASLISLTTNIIVITLNYRLGVFGFLPITSDGRKRGNYGLYDVIAVLRWVHDNIQAFGGDTDRVSLAGHGIGSDFVDLLTASPLAKGEEENGLQTSALRDICLVDFADCKSPLFACS